jgi:hypothetical protein
VINRLSLREPRLAGAAARILIHLAVATSLVVQLLRLLFCSLLWLAIVTVRSTLNIPASPGKCHGPGWVDSPGDGSPSFLSTRKRGHYPFC